MDDASQLNPAEVREWLAGSSPRDGEVDTREAIQARIDEIQAQLDALPAMEPDLEGTRVGARPVQQWEREGWKFDVRLCPCYPGNGGNGVCGCVLGNQVTC